MPRDVDVVTHGNSLDGKRILLGITGGIAAVESVRLGRELRRHGAEIHVNSKMYCSKDLCLAKIT